MITWIKKICRKLRAPPHTVVHCDHYIEVFGTSIRVTDEERFYTRDFLSDPTFADFIKRQLCSQLANELLKYVEVFEWTDGADPFSKTYSVRLKVVLDNKKEPK